MPGIDVIRREIERMRNRVNRQRAEITQLRHAGNYGMSGCLAPGGLFKKKSRLPVAASAYWSMATMIA